MKMAPFSRNGKGKLKNKGLKRGEFKFGPSDCSKIIKSPSTFSIAIDELRFNGFIEMRVPGGFPNKKGIFAFSDKWKTFRFEEGEKGPRKRIIGYKKYKKPKK